MARLTKWHHNRLTSFKGVDIVIDGMLARPSRMVTNASPPRDKRDLSSPAPKAKGNADGIVLQVLLMTWPGMQPGL